MCATVGTVLTECDVCNSRYCANRMWCVQQ